MKHLKNTKGGFIGRLVVIRQGEIVGDPEPEDLLLGSLWKLLTSFYAYNSHNRVWCTKQHGYHTAY